MALRNLEYDTFTPVIGAPINVSSVTSPVMMWYRIGNIVQCAFEAEVTDVAAATSAFVVQFPGMVFDPSKPFAGSATKPGVVARVSPTGGDGIQVVYTALGAGSSNLSFQLTFQI